MKIRFILILVISCCILLLIVGCAAQKTDVRETAVQAIPKVEREFRAAWIASVANINWPSKPGLSSEAQKEEALVLLDLLKDHHFNAAILQIRPQCDALYPSELEPWSYYLTGQQGKAPEPFYDPLKFWVEQAHLRGIELHVWFNPYRAHHVSGKEVTEFSIVKKRPELVVKLKSGYYWMDPANPQTQDHSYAVVMDVVKRYDIDGVHFDDYFYPYPSYNDNEDFPDDASWAAYQQTGGKLSRGDWRREAVNIFIKRVYEGIKQEKPYVKFGLSPFGIWRPNNPASIQGFDQYEKLYADARLWLNEGWIDYWTPQLYWPVNQIPQSYPVLLGWWEQENKKKRHIWPGMSIGRLQGEKRVDETINQIMITRGILPGNPGNVHWSIGPLLNDARLAQSILQGPYKRQALVPASPWLDNTPPEVPRLKTAIENDSLIVTWSHKNARDVFHWAIVYQYGDRWNYKILSQQKRSISFPLFVLKNSDIRKDSLTENNIAALLNPISKIAVSAVDRLGNESAPVQASIPEFSAKQIASIDNLFPAAVGYFHLAFLDSVYENYQFCNIPAEKLKNKQVIGLLQKLAEQFPEDFHYEQVGQSVQGRPIHLVRMGTGKTKILLWSQMHGNEPTATAALFDIFYYLLKNRETPFVQNILKNITILAVPMLNPDGAEKFARRNAQGIDINRDARDLQSPEGRLLFQLKEQYQPAFGFNLHDQDARRTVGSSNKLAAIALMAPPFDARDRDNPVRIRAKKIAAVIRQALAPHISGHIAKYDADYMPRAFGDSMQNWGVSTVLIESGGWEENRTEFLEKMNFIALLSSFKAIADGSYQQANVSAYESLPENGRRIYDLIIRDVSVIDGSGIPPFRADIAINYHNNTGTIADIGDLDIFAAKETIDGEALTLTPGLTGVVHHSPANGDAFIRKSKEMIKAGFTTILLMLEKEALKNSLSLKQLIATNNIPANLGGVLYLNQKLLSPGETLQMLRYMGKDMIGMTGDQDALKTFDPSGIINKPAIPITAVNQTKTLRSLDSQAIQTLTSDQTTQWKIPRRGKIRSGQIADFILFSTSADSLPVIDTIFLKGQRVWQQGEWIQAPVSGERWLPF